MKFFDFLKNKEKWLKYYEDLKSFFSNRFLTDAIIPYDLINVASSIINKKSEEQIFRFIIGCSIVIGILVAIPGDIGVGLYVAQALEFTMAVNIARLVGLDFKKENVFKLLGVVGISSLAVLYAFEKVLQVIFKLGKRVSNHHIINFILIPLIIWIIKTISVTFIN